MKCAMRSSNGDFDRFKKIIFYVFILFPTASLSLSFFLQSSENAVAKLPSSFETRPKIHSTSLRIIGEKKTLHKSAYKLTIVNMILRERARDLQQ